MEKKEIEIPIVVESAPYTSSTVKSEFKSSAIIHEVSFYL